MLKAELPYPHRVPTVPVDPTPEKKRIWAELRGYFITWPHPALHFSPGFVILHPTPCPLGLSTARGGSMTTFNSHTPLGPELLACASRSFWGLASASTMLQPLRARSLSAVVSVSHSVQMWMIKPILEDRG